MELVIDGKTCECKKGEFLLDVARRNAIYIPSLCERGDLDSGGSCRVCIVEVESKGKSSIVTSCIYPVETECVVYTNSERVKRDRAMLLALLRDLAPDSPEIAQLAEFYKAPTSKRFTKNKNKNSSCILCGLCVKTCDAVGASAIALMGRGTEKRLATPYDEASPDCIGCASCAVVCPTHHICCEEDTNEGIRTIWGKTFKLVACCSCGKYINTAEQIEASLRVGKVPTNDSGEAEPLCDVCKRKAVADNLAEVHAP